MGYNENLIRLFIQNLYAKYSCLICSIIYALVGGSECVVLGSTRATQDVDLVVLRGGTSNARQLLRASSYFEVEPRTNHTTYKAERPVPIEILTSPLLFRESFDQSTEVVTVGSVKDKRKTYSVDISFLLKFCARTPEYLPRATEVPNATKELVQYLIQFYGGQEAWVRAGYIFQTGRFNRN
ncbi:hypothetical protein BDV33DRAFT_196832 [Aspergillus novoparasiticus]|uniref:Uncharacterized protein n=1 Tax=Aspergillus novoparasiticus TaxID=986946 RepID=A0A5N6E8F5_9EURO|nr:hypothetical protein BDV33DRAFT_196832 [Aspergillus novoparasiticus]